MRELNQTDEFSVRLSYKLTAILRRQFCIIMTANTEYSRQYNAELPSQNRN